MKTIHKVTLTILFVLITILMTCDTHLSVNQKEDSIIPTTEGGAMIMKIQATNTKY